jgi:hypothetical protein
VAEVQRKIEMKDPMGPLMVPPKNEYRYPWKNTDVMLSFILLWLVIVLLICTPAVVAGVYRWLW